MIEKLCLFLEFYLQSLAKMVSFEISRVQFYGILSTSKV